MHEALSKVLGEAESAAEIGTDRILAAAFFRKRPLQAGASAQVVHLAERRPQAHREGFGAGFVGTGRPPTGRSRPR